MGTPHRVLKRPINHRLKTDRHIAVAQSAAARVAQERAAMRAELERLKAVERDAVRAAVAATERITTLTVENKHQRDQIAALRAQIRTAQHAREAGKA